MTIGQYNALLSQQRRSDPAPSPFDVMKGTQADPAPSPFDVMRPQQQGQQGVIPPGQPGSAGAGAYVPAGYRHP